MKEKSSFRKTAEILFPFLLYYVVWDLANYVLLIILNLLMQLGGETYELFFIRHVQTAQGIISGMAMLIGLLAIRKMAKQEIKVTDGEKITDAAGQITEYMFLFGLAFTSAAGINILFTLTGLTASSESYANVANNQYGIPFWVGMVIFGIISPLAEEVLFRGIIYNRMKKYYPLPLAMIVSALFFGVYHGNMVQGLYGTIMGLLMVFVYEKYDTFMAPVLFHAVANISIYTLMYKPETFEAAVRPFTCAAFLAAAVVIFLYIQYYFKKKQQKNKKI